MANNALYDIFASKCFSLAHTMVIHSELLAKSQNTLLEQKGFLVNHNNPRSWKYFLNLSGQYHDYDKDIIANLNADGHPYMQIKIAGDNQPFTVDFTRELVSGVGGDYTLAAEYSYGSEYYKELVSRYPGCETLILGILNPIDIETAIEANDGDILYCGGYYRKRLPGLKELYGFERREDVTIDTEFLVEEWEEEIIFELQDFIKLYLKRWIIQDYQANHTFFAAVMHTGLMGGVITEIHRLRLAGIKSYTANSYHVREYINSYGYLGEYVDALTREQSMYLYYNMRWLTTNKGKHKVLTALIDNLLTPSGIPLVAYNLGHDTWSMQNNNTLTPTIEFKKEYLNLDPLTNDVGTSTKELLLKESDVARDNDLHLDDRANVIENRAKESSFNKLKTKVLESDFTEQDMNVFFNLEEFQFYQWIFAAQRGSYSGSIFVNHPVTGGRLQLTPLTALVLLIYAHTKGYYGYELETCPSMHVLNIPKSRTISIEASTPYPSNEDLWNLVRSPLITQEKIDSLRNYVIPNHSFSSTTDFNFKTAEMFEVLEERRTKAVMEEDIFANGEMELLVSQFYHHIIEVPPLIDIDYKTWLNNLGIDVTKLEPSSLRALADELMIAGLGTSDNLQRSTERMHEAITNILRFFLSYTVQLIAKFTKSSTRTYGFKQIRISHTSSTSLGLANMDIGVVTFVANETYVVNEFVFCLDPFISSDLNETHIVGSAGFPLIDLVLDNSEQVVEINRTMDISGIFILESTPLAPTMPYGGGSTSSFIFASVPDVNAVDGLRLGMSVSDLTIELVDTLGLDPISNDGFEFITTK